MCEVSDQPVNSRNLINIFTGRILDSQGCKVCFMRATKIAQTAQADLSRAVGRTIRRNVFSHCGSYKCLRESEIPSCSTWYACMAE